VATKWKIVSSETGITNLSKIAWPCHEERNPRVFLKDKIIQTTSQLNPDRQRLNYSFSGCPAPNGNFVQTNIAQ